MCANYYGNKNMGGQILPKDLRLTFPQSDVIMRQAIPAVPIPHPD